MERKTDLQKRILELKLEKRDLVLAGKSTTIIDKEIKSVESKLQK